MGSIDELRVLFRELLEKYEQVRPTDHGLLGDGRGNLWVPDDSDHRVWFRKNGQASQLVKVHCWRVRPIEDLPVVCGYTPEQPTFYQVLTCDREMLELNWRGMSTVPRHAEMHIWGDALGGDDPVMVWTRALMPFRVSPQVTPDFTVRIEGPEMYLWQNTWNRWPGNVSFDLTASYPGAGNHIYVLVSIDGATNAAQATSGTAVPVAMPIPSANYPTPPAGSVPVALVHLVEAAVAGNEIHEADILDARILVGSSGGSVTPAAHALLGAQHSGTVAQDPSQGSLVYGDATPEWNELVIGAAHQIFKVNAAGTLPTYTAFDWDEVNAAVGADMVHDHTVAGEGSQLDHGAAMTAASLLDDDHPQYLLADGTRPLTGAWDTGAQLVTFGGGVTFEAGVIFESSLYLDSVTPLIYINHEQSYGLVIDDTAEPAIEYLNICTLAAQRKVVWNEGGADIDFRVEAVGQPNALFIEGSTGNVGFGTPTPGFLVDLLDIYDDTFRATTTRNIASLNPIVLQANRAGVADGDKLSMQFGFVAGAVYPYALFGGVIEDVTSAVGVGFFITAGGAERIRVSMGGYLGIGTPTPGSLTEWNFATSDLEFVNATTVDPGAAADTVTGWIQIELAGVTHYLRCYS